MKERKRERNKYYRERNKKVPQSETPPEALTVAVRTPPPLRDWSFVHPSTAGADLHLRGSRVEPLFNKDLPWRNGGGGGGDGPGRRPRTSVGAVLFTYIIEGQLYNTVWGRKFWRRYEKQIGYTWLRIGTACGLLWTRWWTFGFWRHRVSGKKIKNTGEWNTVPR
jgi:hypothetical protein